MGVIKLHYLNSHHSPRQIGLPPSALVSLHLKQNLIRSSFLFRLKGNAPPQIVKLCARL